MPMWSPFPAAAAHRAARCKARWWIACGRSIALTRSQGWASPSPRPRRRSSPDQAVMKVAIALESPHLSPRARALAVARKLAAGGDVVAAACLMDGAADGPALAARLGLREAYFVADAALAKT